MSDDGLRAAERDAAQHPDDQERQARLRHARCRVGKCCGHAPGTPFSAPVTIINAQEQAFTDPVEHPSRVLVSLTIGGDLPFNKTQVMAALQEVVDRLGLSMPDVGRSSFGPVELIDEISAVLNENTASLQRLNDGFDRIGEITAALRGPSCPHGVRPMDCAACPPV